MTNAIFRFTDPDNDATVRLDISNYISAERQPDFGVPNLEEGTRTLRIPIVVNGTSKDNLLANIQNIVKELERGSSLEVRLDDATSSVWFDSYLSVLTRPYGSEARRSSITWAYNVFQDRAKNASAEIALICKPYARGAEQTVVTASDLANAPNASNFHDATGILGDIAAPARVELIFNDANAASRVIGRLYRRTTGTVANFDSILEAESATLTNNTVSQSEGGASNGNSSRTTPANQNENKTHAWAVSTNVADKTGKFDVFIKVKDRDGTAGRLKARIKLQFPSSASTVSGNQVTITMLTAHLAANYELWYLGTFDVPASPTPTSWTWELYLQRTTGTATIDVDYLFIAPVDESSGIIDFKADATLSGDTTNKTFFGDWGRGTAGWGSLTTQRAPGVRRGLLTLKPGVTNRIIVQAAADAHSTVDDPPTIATDNIGGVTIKYRPLYNFFR